MKNEATVAQTATLKRHSTYHGDSICQESIGALGVSGARRGEAYCGECDQFVAVKSASEADHTHECRGCQETVFCHGDGFDGFCDRC